MSQKFFKPIKKFVSRERAISKLRIQPKQFDELCVLCNVFPVLATEQNMLDRTKGWHYLITDVRKIYYSDSYNVIRTNKENQKRREKYSRLGFEEKLKNCIDEEYGLVELIKCKYASFGDSLSDLGSSLRNLYLIEQLQIADVGQALRLFEEFILARKMIDAAFLSKRGIYLSFTCGSVRVVWSVPYRSANFSSLIEEKADIIKFPSTKGIILPDFPSDTESEEVDDLDPNDPGKMDISLLKYAAPLLSMHLKLALHKLSILYPEPAKTRPGLFRGKNVHTMVASIGRWIDFILESEEANLTDCEGADLVIAETVEDVHSDKTYLQPQYVLDSINSSRLLDFDGYKIGAALPKHVSPFQDVLSRLDSRVLKTLSNTRKYKIQDKIEELL